MNYTKPEVAVLGEAVNVIEHSFQKVGLAVDGNPRAQQLAIAPAYDLDE